MPEDIVRKMGFLCLGSRMKRIGERMQADVARFIEQSGLSVQPSQYPLLLAVEQNGPLTIGELSEAVGVSQPGTTRNVARLIDMGLLEAATDARDQRQKPVTLSAAGRRLMERSRHEIWPFVEAAVREICGDLKGPLLTQLTAIEEGLAEAPLDRRAAARIAKSGPSRKSSALKRAAR
ncbi:MAG: MarR family transcriptional regulator [Alphaproteobacteria bacterium]|nr:MarR family transcriptional regulator [Alphaproteobacteria bacterium]